MIAVLATSPYGIVSRYLSLGLIAFTGEPPGTKKAFGQSMQRRGFETYRVPNAGTRAFRFLRLKAMKEVTRDA